MSDKFNKIAEKVEVGGGKIIIRTIDIISGDVEGLHFNKKN